VAAAKLDWLLGAQAAYGDASVGRAVMAAARSRASGVRLAGARALKSLGATDDVMKLIAELLRAKGDGVETFLQAEATRALVAIDPDGRRAVDMILAALPASDPRGGGSTELMDPVLRYDASGTETMVRALTRYRAARAEPALVGLLKQKEVTGGVLDALMAHFLVLPSTAARAELLRLYAAVPDRDSDELRRYHRFFVRDADPRALDAAFTRMLRSQAELWPYRSMLKDYALHRARGDARLESAMVQLLRARSGDEHLVYLVPLALSIATQSTIDQLLGLDPDRLGDGGAETLAIVARAVALQRSPPADPNERMQAWLRIVEDDRKVGFSSVYLLRELVCSTPKDQHDGLATLLEKNEPNQHARAAIRFLRSISSKSDAAERDDQPLFACFAAVSAAAPVTAPRAPAVSQPPSVPRRSGCAGCATTAQSRPPPWGWSLVLLACHRLRRVKPLARGYPGKRA
jgi:hypothetical protein